MVKTPALFLGQYDHQLEERGRLSIPKKFRLHLESGAVISLGLDGCLFLYPLSGWQDLMSKIASLPLTAKDARSFTRLLTYNAAEVEFDRLGRVLIPDFLRQIAGISSRCVIAGALNRVEIWDKQKFTDYQSSIQDKSHEIAEHLKDAGV